MPKLVAAKEASPSQERVVTRANGGELVPPAGIDPGALRVGGHCALAAAINIKNNPVMSIL